MKRPASILGGQDIPRPKWARPGAVLGGALEEIKHVREEGSIQGGMGLSLAVEARKVDGAVVPDVVVEGEDAGEGAGVEAEAEREDEGVVVLRLVLVLVTGRSIRSSSNRRGGGGCSSGLRHLPVEVLAHLGLLSVAVAARWARVRSSSWDSRSS